MSDLGDITKLIVEDKKNLSSLDWLSLSEEEYRAIERLPKQNLDSVPELEKQWSILRPESDFELSQDNVPAPTTPFHSEQPQYHDISSEDKAKMVSEYLKKHYLSGMDIKQAMARLPTAFDKNTLSDPLVKENIKAASSEAGLLGHVYVDPSLFPKCGQGEGQDFVAKFSKQAKFVLAKDECGGCKWAQEGRCAIFKKEIVTEVDYDQNLWSFYQSKAKALGKDLSHIDESMSHKVKIRQASFAPTIQSQKTFDGKPVLKDASSHISLEEAREKISSLDIRQEVVSNFRRSNKRQKIASRLLQGHHGQQEKDFIYADPDLEDFREHFHLLGNLYVDASYFDNEESFVQYREANTHLPLYQGSIKTSEILDLLATRYVLAKWRGGEKTKVAKLKKRFQSLTESEVREIAQSIFAEPLPVGVKVHENLYPVYDPTKGISFKEAKKRLANTTITREVVADRRVDSLEQKIVHQMMMGNHGKDIQARIKSAGLTHLNRHLNILGNLYLIDKYVDVSDIKRMASKRPILSNLPILSEDRVSTFLSSPETQNIILARYKATGKDGYAKVASKISSLPESSLVKIAQHIYSLPIKNVKEYDFQGKVYDPTEGISYKEASEKLKKARHVQEKIGYDLRTYVQAGGQSILKLALTKFGKDAVTDLWLNKGKQANVVKDYLRKEKLEKHAYLEVTNPSFRPLGRDVKLVKPLFQTKVGKWLRDRLVSGSLGMKLSEEIVKNWDKDVIVEHAPLVLAIREEEGLFGKAYVEADAYLDCNTGKRASSQVQQVVKASKCSGCIYNVRGDQCSLYQKPLVEEPEYTMDMVAEARKMALLERHASDHKINEIVNSNMTPKGKVRALNLLNNPHTPKRTAESHNHYQGFFGSSVEDTKVKAKVGNMLREARNLLLDGQDVSSVKIDLLGKYGHKVMKVGNQLLDTVIDRTLDTIEDKVDMRNVTARTGLDQMEDVDLLPSSVNSPLDDFDFNEPKQEDNEDSIDIADYGFGGLTLE